MITQSKTAARESPTLLLPQNTDRMNSLSLTSAARLTNSTAHLSQWRSQSLMESSFRSSRGNVVFAGVLSFLAAALASGAGVGGGSLFVAILSNVSGLSVETATVFARFMVTGGSLSNVLYTIFLRSPGPSGEPLIDYDIVVASQPCMLLGVSVGVVCNVMFPEWLVTSLFTVFLAFTTFKTYRTGIKRWRAETVAMRRMQEGGDDADRTKDALLARKAAGGRQCQWIDMALLVMVWLCFFLVHLLVGGGMGAKVAVDIKPCGVAYWLINVAQIPITVAFTACVVHQKRKSSRTQNGLVIVHEIPHNCIFSKGQAVSVTSRLNVLPADVFPVAALLTGVMSGLFDIGGGLLLNPIFFHVGVPPKTATATTMFMILFSSSMSTVRSVILGADGVVKNALVYAVVCLVASVVGIVVVEGAVRRSGRVSLVVLAVATVMALSAAVTACSGAARVWAQCTASGQDMGFKFKLPC